MTKSSKLEQEGFKSIKTLNTVYIKEEEEEEKRKRKKLLICEFICDFSYFFARYASKNDIFILQIFVPAGI